jgi:trk system potassium uptake protein TrkA
LKILITGDGKLGAAITRQLSREGYDVTLIDTDPNVLESTMEKYDVITIQGNGATMEVLKEAGVEDADLMIAVTGEDELNLLVCMTARAMNGRLHTIARLRNPEYAQQAYQMRNIFGLSLVVNPERSTAQEIERLIRYPGFLKSDMFAKGRVDIVEIRIEQSSILRNVVLSNLNSIIKCKILVCAVLRDGTVIAPDGSCVLQEGDRIFVTASTENLTMLLKNLGIATRKIRHVLIAGGGRISYYLADLLEKSGISSEIIERDPERCRELTGLLPNVNIVQGDASQPAFLDDEGIAEADALVTLTGLDELNIIISMYGHSKNIPVIVTKVGRYDNSELLNDLPIGSIVSPKELTCNRIMRYVRALKAGTGAAVTIHKIADGQAEAIEFVADETTRHLGEPLKNIRTKSNALIACISNGPVIDIPNGDSVFQKGYSVVVVCTGDDIPYSLNDIFID